MSKKDMLKTIKDEDVEYVDSIKEDIRWLGFDWGDRFFFASDYYERLYQFAVRLIEKGKAFVDDLTPEEIRQHRGTLTEPGTPSPYRDRAPEENRDLAERMGRRSDHDAVFLTVQVSQSEDNGVVFFQAGES